MKVIYTKHAKQDYEYWVKNQPKVIERIDKLISEIKKSPFNGIGKPEPLRFEKSDYWSRRINREHRLVYRVEGNDLYIVQCRYHY